MKKANYVLMVFLTMVLSFVLVACTQAQRKIEKTGEEQMETVFSEVEFIKFPKMKVAMHRIVSSNPEEDVMNYMDNWAKESGLLDVVDFTPRKFGWDYPHLTEEQKLKNLRGYELCYTLPENFSPKIEGVDILYIEADEYAVIKITDPFTNAFETIPNGWKKLSEFVMGSEYEPKHLNNRYVMEEVIEKDGIIYMYIYFPIK